MTAQVLTAIALGVVIGAVKPAWGEAMKPLGDGFIRLVTMVVGPLIFLTIVVGISTMGNLKKVGRVGVKALIYFEVVTTLALLIGMVVANIAKPGHGIVTSSTSTTAPATLPSTQSSATQAPLAPTGPATMPVTAPAPRVAVATPAEVPASAEGAKKQTTVEFLLSVIPNNIFKAFTDGNLLQILVFSVLCGCAIASLGPRCSPLIAGLENLTEVMFRIVAIIMKVAPLGALGAMAYTIGKFGLGSLLPLAKLMVCVYLTMAIFIFVVLGLICRLFGFRLMTYLAYIKEEILLVLGTSSSESALPRMIEKLERLGCSRAIVGMVIPAGYSFNLDGTSIYLSMAVLFIAQALGVELSLGQQLGVMAVLMLTSKGAAAVTGAGLVTLSATLESTHLVPVAGLALLVGVDRFMSEARAITNLIGNGIATICVSKWEGEFDPAMFDEAIRARRLAGQDLAEHAFPVVEPKVHSEIIP
ncbi:cation:dicarboxylate symporter family transporter [Humisphaera borealis]